MKKQSGQLQMVLDAKARLELGENLLALARAWLNNDLVWQPPTNHLPRFWSLVRRHGLDGMVGGLVAAGAEVPNLVSEPAFEIYCTNTLRLKQAVTLCKKICDVARFENIPLSFVKGPALATAYGDEGVRGFGDVDVLVPDGNPARKLAARCGFSIRHGAVDVPARFWQRATAIGRVEASAGNLEIEFTFAPMPANEPLYEFFQRWPERYLLRPDSENPFPIPRPEAHLLFLLQHLAQHWCDRVIWLVDFAVLMRNGQCDPGWLEHAAATLEMRKLLRAVTSFCRRHLDESLPELGRGPAGWKDGLYLRLLSPDTFTRTVFHKYGHQCGAALKNALLGSFQHVFATDLEQLAVTRRRAAPRWMGEWLQHVFWPGGKLIERFGPLVTPIMFLAMTVLVSAVFRQTPRGFARMPRLLSNGKSLRTENQNEPEHVAA